MRHISSQLFLNLSLLLIHTLLLLSLTPLAEAKKKTQTAAAARSAVPGSGELSTKAGHSCTWATSSQGADDQVSLQVSCSVPGETPAQTYQCRFAGRPEQCPAYADKANQYWKQVVGKLKKRDNACDGEKVLKTRLCKKGPSAAHVRLVERSGEEAEEDQEGPKGKKERRERQTAVPLVKETEVAARRTEREGRQEPLVGARDGYGEEGEGRNADSEVSSYCAEGWHSLCSFFVKFFDG
ncbi:hypothetical protein ACEWY4_021126 [Coilia grayii]|uniref:Uncharacterized protein n=1 Tax=Coilia grayii TaxID=363190 RepID=A0ABD1J865_9TELE